MDINYLCCIFIGLYAHEKILVPLARLAWDLDLELFIAQLIVLIQSYLTT